MSFLVNSLERIARHLILESAVDKKQIGANNLVYTIATSEDVLFTLATKSS
jgi:hypothetical protein